eukprot:4588564-Amphidinium_carterae.1
MFAVKPEDEDREGFYGSRDHPEPPDKTSDSVVVPQTSVQDENVAAALCLHIAESATAQLQDTHFSPDWGDDEEAQATDSDVPLTLNHTCNSAMCRSGRTGTWLAFETNCGFLLGLHAQRFCPDGLRSQTTCPNCPLDGQLLVPTKVHLPLPAFAKGNAVTQGTRFSIWPKPPRNTWGWLLGCTGAKPHPLREDYLPQTPSLRPQAILDFCRGESSHLAVARCNSYGIQIHHNVLGDYWQGFGTSLPNCPLHGKLDVAATRLVWRTGDDKKESCFIGLQDWIAQNFTLGNTRKDSRDYQTVTSDYRLTTLDHDRAGRKCAPIKFLWQRAILRLVTGVVVLVERHVRKIGQETTKLTKWGKPPKTKTNVQKGKEGCKRTATHNTTPQI